MSSAANFIQLAKSLPEPLQRFFARWPPAAIVPSGTPPTIYQQERTNPFQFYKHPITGKWQDPVFSQRRQAELAKMAHEHGVQDLLPETAKSKESRLAHRIEHGLRVKGTGVGQKVKGRLHERHMIARYASFPKDRSVALTLTVCAIEWNKEEKPCWRCPNSSRPGKRYAHGKTMAQGNEANNTLLGWQEELDQVPEINSTGSAEPHLNCIKTTNMYIYTPVILHKSLLLSISAALQSLDV